MVYLTISRPDIALAVPKKVSLSWLPPGQFTLQQFIGFLDIFEVPFFEPSFFPSSSSLELRATTDADWAYDPSDRCSTTGFCLFWGGRAKSKRLFSSAEAEYRAMAYTTGEIVWLRW